MKSEKFRKPRQALHVLSINTQDITKALLIGDVISGLRVPLFSKADNVIKTSGLCSALARDKRGIWKALCVLFLDNLHLFWGGIPL